MKLATIIKLFFFSIIYCNIQKSCTKMHLRHFNTTLSKMYLVITIHTILFITFLGLYTSTYQMIPNSFMLKLPKKK